MVLMLPQRARVLCTLVLALTIFYIQHKKVIFNKTVYKSLDNNTHTHTHTHTHTLINYCNPLPMGKVKGTS